MKLLIAHLSDIHIQTPNDPILPRAGAIAAAIGSLDPTCRNYLIAITGDIAYSGKPHQYELASTFLTQLKQELRKHVTKCEIETTLVPGNHDCDFAEDSKARQLIIAAVQGDDRSAIDASVTDVILKVQDPFFAFAADNGEPHLAGRQRLYHHRGVMFGSQSVLLKSYNTAWMSTLPETATKYFPVELADTAVANHDFVLSLLHHPLSWFAPAHARELRRHLETTSDVILTGHEHVAAMRDIRSMDGERVTYTEGAVLQESGLTQSGFNLVLIDFDRGVAQKVRCESQTYSSPYVLSTGRKWEPFERAKHLTTSKFPISEQHRAWLDDVGAPFTHPYKERLSLPDVFVDVELDAMLSLSRRKDQRKTISSVDLAALVAAPGVLVVGPEQCGKTTLAKVMVRRLHRDGNVPVYVVGSGFKSPDPEGLTRLLEVAVREQYAATTADAYLQLPLERRILIMDDFDACGLSRSAKARLLNTCQQYFGKVIAFAEDSYMLEEIAEGRSEEEEFFLDADVWRIKEFGHFLRGVLIERWLTLGREASADDKELARQIEDTERLVNTIRGRNLVPAYPIVILTLLQTIESNFDLSTVSGSFGQRYEFLINTRLRINNKSLPRDAVLALTSEIAFASFSERRRHITADQLRRATGEYAQAYLLPMPFESVLRTLTDSDILESHSGSYRFKYPYVYFYFVAKYFARHLNDPSKALGLRAKISDIVAQLHVNEYANIIIFLAYLTADGDVIRRVIDHAKAIYSSETPCDLEGDIDFLTSMTAPRINFTVPDGNYRAHRQEEQRKIDLRDQHRSDDEYGADGDEERLIRLNPSIKALQILGQILRNFAGSLPGELKIEMATECYHLGLRTIQAAFTVIRHKLGDMIEFLAKLLRETGRYDDHSDAEVRIEAEQILFVLVRRWHIRLFRRSRLRSGRSI